MNITEAENRVIEFLCKQLGEKPETILLGTDLFRDLGVDGADAEEVIDGIAHEFGVDFSRLEWGRHFGPERGCNPFALLLPSWWRWQRERIPVTVRDLARAVVAKQWSMEYRRDA